MTRHTRAALLLALASLATSGISAGPAHALSLPMTSFAAQCPLPFVGTGNGSASNPGVGPCAAIPPPYPDYGPYGSAGGVSAAGQQLSDQLRAYIVKWMNGQAPATLPANLVPSGTEPLIGDFTLQRPDQVDPAKEWFVRPAHAIDPSGEEGFYPDPSVTYLVLPTLYAPFGTRVQIQGQFPHSRFFDVQASPPFDPNTYYYGGSTGAGASEVPIADLDINPDCGSVNPFRLDGAGPSPCPVSLPSSGTCASRRHFHVRVPRRVQGRRVRRATVYVRHRRFRVLRGRRLRAPVDLRGLPKGTFQVRVVIITVGGHRYVQTHAYHTCVPKRRHRPAPPHRPRARGATAHSTAAATETDGERNAPDRSYTINVNLAAGDAVALNPAFKPPFRNTPDNTLYGGGIEYVGPGGCDKAYQPLSKGRGCFSTGNIWTRYYLPDKGANGQLDPLGGVPLPKVLYAIKVDGQWRQFYIQADIGQFGAWANQKAALVTPSIVQPGNPRTDTEGSQVGWFPEYGVLRTIAESLSRALFSPSLPTIQLGEQYSRDYDRGFDSHGEDVPGEGRYEHAATEADYVNYLTRTMNRASGNVVVITGRMPTVPRTVGGETAMTAGQARYWSLTAYISLFTYPAVQPGTTPGSGANTNNWPGVPVSSIYDEQVHTDSQGRYVLVYSSPEDRPSNADAAHGVTWVNWGPSGIGDESFTLRLLSVRPQWSFCRTPDEVSLGWRGDMSATVYDPTLFASNTPHGFLGDYQPVFHYMTKAGFEALGNHVSADQIPAWSAASNSNSPTDSGPGVAPGPAGC